MNPVLAASQTVQFVINKHKKTEQRRKNERNETIKKKQGGKRDKNKAQDHLKKVALFFFSNFCFVQTFLNKKTLKKNTGLSLRF